MSQTSRAAVRGSFLRPLYLGLAHSYRKGRRLFSYPATAPRWAVVPYEGRPLLKDRWPSLVAAGFIFVLTEAEKPSQS